MHTLYKEYFLIIHPIVGGASANPKFSFLPQRSTFRRMLNNEERMKLSHFRRFFHEIPKDDFIRRVNVARKRVARINRRSTFATLDENGLPPPSKSSKQR